MRKIYSLFLFLSASSGLFSQNQPVAATDMLKIKTVGNIVATRDGSKAAFTLTSIEADEKNNLDYKYVTQIYLSRSSDNWTPQQLTYSKEGASQPSWSMDGKQLAFVRAVEGRPQIFILQMNGGEPIQLTKFKYGANNPKWSPDGSEILFTSDIQLPDLIRDSIINPYHHVPSWPFEKPGFVKNENLLINTAKPNPDGTPEEVRAYLSVDEKDKKAVVLNKLNFQNEFSVTSEQNLSEYFIISVANPKEPVLLTPGFYNFNNAFFTPDGSKIIFSGNADSLESPDRVLESAIYMADNNGNNFRKLLGSKGKSFTNASLSHSGKWLSFQYSGTSFISVPMLAIMPLGGKENEIIDIPFDRGKGGFSWSADDKYLYFISQSNGGAPLNRVNISSKKIEALSGFESGITGFALLNNNILFSKTQVSDPSELYLSDANMRNEKMISSFNDWVKNRQLSFPVKRKFTNKLGMDVEYWVMKPTNYREGQKYPLLLEIHGGPSAMWGPGEASMWQEFQYFCGKGYGIVYSNPRGSGGYGLNFLRSIINDWGTGPSSDVLTALDKTVAEGWADTGKLMITGGSYAGYLTAWIIGHDNRFKAACSQRGVYDLSTFFGEGNAWRLVPNYFGGYPWEPKVKEILVRESPITYVQNITTPYIIFHGGSDRRTGFVQGEMMYRSLKVLGRPVEYVVHPNATHELTRSGDNRQRLDQLLRTYEFFQRWIGK